MKQSEVTFSEGLGENLPFPGIGYLGVGYDIIKGNPEGDGTSLVDPGYRGPVVALSWDQDSRFNSRDMRKLTPTQGYGTMLIACNHASTATRQTSMSDYTKSLESDVSRSREVGIGGGYAGITAKAEAKFSASKGVRSFRNDVVTKNKERFEMKSYCVQYKTTLQSPASILQTDEYFNKRVAALNTLSLPTGGSCESSVCTTLYVQAANRYIGVTDSSVVLTKQTGTGVWLISDTQVIHWVTKESGWVVDNKKVLTREDDKLVVKPLGKTEDVVAMQQWSYDEDSLLLFAEDTDDANGLTIGWDEKTVTGDAAPKLAVLKGHGKQITRNHVPEDTENVWAIFFEDFGTHFISSVELGGRMVTSITMDSDDVKTVEQEGVSASWAVSRAFGAGYGAFEAKGSQSKEQSTKKQTDAINSVMKSKNDVKTFVLGGVPPETISKESSYGFGEWAETVSSKPMPVRIRVTPIDRTQPFQCDKNEAATAAQKLRCKGLRATFGIMFRKYEDNTLRALRTENMELKSAALAAHLDQSSFTAQTYECPVTKKSPDGRSEVVCDTTGNLMVRDEYGDVLWTTSTGCRNAYLWIERSNFQIYCGGPRTIIWKAFPNSTGCGVTNDENTRLTLGNDGNLKLHNAKNILWQSGTGVDAAGLPKKHRAFQSSHGYIMCEAARERWNAELEIKYPTCRCVSGTDFLCTNGMTYSCQKDKRCASSFFDFGDQYDIGCKPKPKPYVPTTGNSPSFGSSAMSSVRF